MIIWLAVALGLLAIDQVSKALIVANFRFEGQTLPILQDFFHLTYVRNSGAVFGIGGDHGWLLYFFVAAAFAASAFFVVMFVKSDKTDKRLFWFRLSLVLLVAGTLGNLIDRLFQPDHQVVDFLDFRGIWPYVFNFADMCLCVGIALFLFDQLILEPKRGKAHGQS